MFPNFREEKKLWKKGFKRVTGVDEAGRGPLAGPVMAAAVSIIANCKLRIANLKEIKDSKKLTAKKREEFYQILTKNPAIEWGIGKVSEKVIDKINILEATKLAMKKAVRNLERKIGKRIDFLLIDGNFTIPYLYNSHGRVCISERSHFVASKLRKQFGVKLARLRYSHAQKSIIKADEKVFSCTAASIIAKIMRDRIMQRYHKKFPRYGFDRHKGYPTKLHLKMLKKYDPCKIHRKTFKPVRACKVK